MSVILDIVLGFINGALDSSSDDGFLETGGVDREAYVDTDTVSVGDPNLDPEKIVPTYKN